MEFTASQIAQLIQGTVKGDGDVRISSFAKIEEGVPGAISFLADTRYEHYLYNTKSSAVLVNADFTPSQPVPCTLIRVADARECIGRLLTMAQQTMQRRSGIHPQACVDPDATVGEGCYIGPFVYIASGVVIGRGTQVYAGCTVEQNARVGEDCTLYPHVSVYHDCVVGNRVILHSGCSIGADGFGFAPTEGGYEKIPQVGNAVIEDDVEIGANACVDRAVMGSTIVRHGAKIDNLVQIAHNCEIGAHTVMSAQVGVAGSAKIGQWCMFGGQVGIAGHIEVADRTQSGAQAGIAGSVRKPGQTIIGSPAMDARKFARCTAVFKNLPEMYADVNQLKRHAEGDNPTAS
ncbi:MAG: UDP-3-O-(3-hydroxymyristoyl)glucosamine N-acyltransferase [Alloprevotella sp.]|nr:UDP-3-O-(3-hydroxymyristoyl)glucosamine N-acyltransferase [Alloprevotella sp.]